MIHATPSDQQPHALHRRPLMACVCVLALAHTHSVAATVINDNLRIYGKVDMGYKATSARTRNSPLRTSALDSGIWTASRIGFAMDENLDADWRAFAVLEYNLLIDSNAGLGTKADGTGNSRDTLVGLAAPWGEVRLGRQITPGHAASLAYDALISSNFSPLMTLTDKNTFRLTTTLDGASRMNNAASYRSPALPIGDGKLEFGTMLALAGSEFKNGTITASSDTLPTSGSQERFTAFRLDYTHAPSGWTGSLVTHRVSDLAFPSATAGAMPGTTQREDFLGIGNKQERFGLNAVYQRASRTAPGAATLFDRVSYVNGNVELKANESLRLGVGRYVSGANHDDHAQSVALTWLHTLSKRTLLYLGGMRVRNYGAMRQPAMGSGAVPDAGFTTSGWSAGINHVF